MSRTSVCSGRVVLKRLLDGSLAEHEQKAIDHHYEACDACQAELEELAYDEEGNPSPISCPRLEVLKRLLDGSIGDLACEAVEHHLSTCATCQADFDALANGLEPAPRATSCPEPAILRRLLDGSLAQPEQKAIEHHLETCDACQARLDGMACGGRDLPGQMRNLRRDPSPDSPGLRRVIGVLKDELGPEMEATSSTVSTPAQTLDFLDPPDSPGDLGKLGPYRVQEVLGQGGMGIVLKGFDSALHRTVAIKVLAPQLATTSSARQRFAREARAAAAIRNQHVVAIHSVDEWKGLPYLVMEFIPGSSLQARIDRSAPLDLNSILRIGMQTASGLAAAHAQGLVHRDIKPANILLENCVERVKITDFGLARAVDDASLTQSGVVAGTPLFMAPEQARSETIDHRADLFSLGAVLYAMCTGRSPFRASTTLGVLRRVCDDTPRPVREVNPDVPAWLAAIIERLLAKDREKRYQTAEEVVDVLGKHLERRQRGDSESLEVTTAAVDDVGRAKKHRKRRRWLEFLGYLVVLLAGLFVIAEAIGVTNSIAHVLGLRKSALLVIHLSNPDVRVLVNGNRLLPGVGIHSQAMQPSGCLVELFKGEVLVTRKFFDLEPGMMVELEVLNDGTLNIEYDGPIRSPLPMLPRTKTSAGSTELGPDGLRIGPEWIWQPNPPEPPAVPETPLEKDPAGRLRERIVQDFKRDPEVASLMEQIKSTTAEFDHTKGVVRQGADPALHAAQKRLTKLQQEYKDLWKTKSEEIRQRLLIEQNPPDFKIPQ